jgi:SNF2 family DNA or RNA helicase
MPSHRIQWDVDPDSLKAFEQGLTQPPSSRPWFALRQDAEKLALLPAFDRLITLDMNRIEELPHQIVVAQQVLQSPMEGRAILADEVGLGKTIEAGIILKELAVRGLARRVLILTPASLVTQWVEELSDKFFETFTPIERPEDWNSCTRAIASYDRARHDNHARQLLKHRWDLVVVDEAHKCKNHTTARYELLQKIERNYILLLTATPLQNDLRELYNLVTLLRPGHFGTWRDFKRAYVASGNAREVRDHEKLRELTARVMVRTRRASVAHVMNLPARRPRHPDIRLSGPETALYGATARLLKDLYREGFRHTTEEEEEGDRRRRRARTGRGIYFLECLRLAQRLCSSTPALAASLDTLSRGELIRPEYRLRVQRLGEQARATTGHAKLQALTDVLALDNERLVVFSEHLPTIDLIYRQVVQLGRPAIKFTGSLSRHDRSLAIKRFRKEPAGVFVSTRAGTEGLNLQFCHRLVNYELPWNPMMIEQRIGRVHRIGQTREVELFNFAAQGTVESHILRLLHSKIRLFELVIGELDLILDQMDDDDGGKLESLLGDIWLNAESDESFEQELDRLGDEIVAKKEVAREEEAVSSRVAAEDAAGRLVREFTSLSVPARLRLGYGTIHLALPRGVEVARDQLGIHVAEILEILGAGPHVEMGGMHPDYGPTYQITGITATGREISLTAQADRLPMTLVDISGDARVPLAI